MHIAGRKPLKTGIKAPTVSVVSLPISQHISAYFRAAAPGILHPTDPKKNKADITEST